MKDYHICARNAALKGDVFIRKTFANVYVDRPSLDYAHLSRFPTMIACTHRSHMDYIILGIEMQKLGYTNLRFAAGDNLTNMPYIGKKFRSWGAFPVYRAHSQRRSYIFKLTEQVVTMLNDQENIIVFPEGGRSYNGAMMQIKSGILAANIIAQYRYPEKEYMYLPVAISYERLPELLYFELLQKGKVLRDGKKNGISRIRGNLYYFGSDLMAFAVFLSAHKFGKKFGDVYIDFGEPVAVNDIVDVKADYSSKSRNEFFAHKVAMQKVGEFMHDQLLKLYRILPMHVVAAIVKRKGFCTFWEAASLVPDVIDSLKRKSRNCKSLQSLQEQEIVEKGLQQLRYSNAVRSEGGKLIPCNRRMINYYSASIEGI